MLGSSETIGLFLGTAIHDTSQVVGAALTYRQMYGDDVVLRVATVTKLTRNMFLAAVIPLLTWMHVRATQAQVGGVEQKSSWKALVPGFVIGFRRDGGRSHHRRRDARIRRRVRHLERGLVASITTQLGDYWASRILLGTAMAAVGLNTSFKVFKGVGLKPFAVGFAGAVVVGAVGMTMAILFGRFVHL